MEVVVTTGAVRRAKLWPNRHPPANQHPTFFTDWMPFLSPNQQRQSTEGKGISSSVDIDNGFSFELGDKHYLAVSKMCTLPA